MNPNQKFEAMTWWDRIGLIHMFSLFPAVTTMVFILRKLGSKDLRPFACAALPISPRRPFDGDASARKTSPDFGLDGRARRKDFLPGIQKPLSPRCPALWVGSKNSNQALFPSKNCQ